MRRYDISALNSLVSSRLAACWSNAYLRAAQAGANVGPARLPGHALLGNALG